MMTSEKLSVVGGREVSVGEVEEVYLRSPGFVCVVLPDGTSKRVRDRNGVDVLAMLEKVGITPNEE